jgi:hypothetical protein
MSAARPALFAVLRHATVSAWRLIGRPGYRGEGNTQPAVRQPIYARTSSLTLCVMATTRTPALVLVFTRVTRMMQC